MKLLAWARNWQIYFRNPILLPFGAWERWWRSCFCFLNKQTKTRQGDCFNFKQCERKMRQSKMAFHRDDVPNEKLDFKYAFKKIVLIFPDSSWTWNANLWAEPETQRPVVEARKTLFRYPNKKISAINLPVFTSFQLTYSRAQKRNWVVWGLIWN